MLYILSTYQELLVLTLFTYFLHLAYPNAKLSPPKKGDSDFQLRSKKLNSAYDMLEDSLRSKVDQNWEQIHKYFHEIDSNRCGYVSKEQFAVSIQFLCQIQIMSEVMFNHSLSNIMV